MAAALSHSSDHLRRAFDLLDRIDYRLAETTAEKEEIYRLRYRAYLKEGTIEPNIAQMITDRFDDLPNSWIFGVYLDGSLMSSLRITVASAAFPDCPSADVFPELVEDEIARGKVIVDPTRFVGEPDRGDARFQELPYMTLRLAYVACEHFEADIGLASVRAEHQAFYRRVFMHRPIGAPRPYKGLLKPICLMAVDYPQMRDKVFHRYPFFRSSFFERRKMFERREADDALGSIVHLPAFPFSQQNSEPSIVPHG